MSSRVNAVTFFYNSEIYLQIETLVPFEKTSENFRQLVN